MAFDSASSWCDWPLAPHIQHASRREPAGRPPLRELRAATTHRLTHADTHAHVQMRKQHADAPPLDARCSMLKREITWSVSLGQSHSRNHSDDIANSDIHDIHHILSNVTFCVHFVSSHSLIESEPVYDSTVSFSCRSVYYLRSKLYIAQALYRDPLTWCLKLHALDVVANKALQVQHTSAHSLAHS